jgi:hypothetical protein
MLDVANGAIADLQSIRWMGYGLWIFRQEKL